MHKLEGTIVTDDVQNLQISNNRIKPIVKKQDLKNSQVSYRAVPTEIMYLTFNNYRKDHEFD